MLFLLSAVVYFAGLLIPSVQIKAAITALWLTVLILLVVDSAVIGLRIRKLMRERFPDSKRAAAAADLLRGDPGHDDPPLADAEAGGRGRRRDLATH